MVRFNYSILEEFELRVGVVVTRICMKITMFVMLVTNWIRLRKRSKRIYYRYVITL